MRRLAISRHRPGGRFAGGRHGPWPLGNASRPARPLCRALRRRGLRCARLRPPRIRRQRWGEGSLRPRGPVGGLARGDRVRPLPLRGRRKPGGYLRLLDGGRQRSRCGSGRPRRCCRDQPGALSRRRPAGAPFAAACDCPDAGRRGSRAIPARGGPAGRTRADQRAGRGGRLAARGRNRRGLALAQPRLLALATGAPVPSGSPRRKAALPLAGLRRRGRPGRQAALPKASFAPTPASTTSTSTTAQSTRHSSPTSSTSSACTSIPMPNWFL
jgi:hypothetical protein